MSVYTVHEPPLRAADALADPQRFIFVRDGFYLWAFLLTPFWMLRHRLWLVLSLYLVLTIGLAIALRFLGASGAVTALAAILISLLVGLEAGTLRRFTLKRRRWANVGIVVGRGVEDAERRFFEAWVREPAIGNSAPPKSAPTAPPPGPIVGKTGSIKTGSIMSDAPGVIGLFPEPGAQR